ncbi:MAG TPA: ABC transporter ATP-binding protein [Acidimicrobiales bacterium]|nr:ABC transporter ATP-binding protein [Acidimicrobiales bacterium]
MTMTADIELTLGALHLQVDVAVGDEVAAVVGPNGAGKTTLLRAIAGLEPLQRGRVTVDGTVVEDAASGVRLPPEERRVGVVFQEHRLFANMSALDNVAFGLRARGASRTDSRRRAAAWLERLGVGHVAGRKPAKLSGGEAQRVALARALVTEPAVLLLDEPLAAVDASARAELRHLLHEELARYRGSRLIVTHDPIEAAALAGQLLVVEDGRVTQSGPLAEVTARPRTRWVATMVGLNLLHGTGDGPVVRLGGGEVLAVPDDVHGPVFAAFRPNAVTLHRDRPAGSARNVWPGRVSELHPAGDRARVRFEGAVPLVAEVTAAAVAELHLADGGPVWASLKATEVDVYPE